MDTHSSILAWRILWIEDAGGLQSMGLQRVGHDCATNFHFHPNTKGKICSLFYSLYFFSQYVCFENKFDENSWERNSSYYMETFEVE